MKERFIMIFIFVFSFIIIVDLYSFKGIRLLLTSVDSKLLKNSIYVVYWAIPLLIIAFLLYFRTLQPFEREPQIFKNFFLLAGLFLLFYVPKLIFIVFHLTEDIIHIGKWVISKFMETRETILNESVSGISRAKFLSQLGLILASIPFTSILYGMTKGRFNFKISHEKLTFPNLPNDFNGFKIIQISDIHIGSLLGHEDQIKEAIEHINDQNPDLILFTGDLVNQKNSSQLAAGSNRKV